MVEAMASGLPAVATAVGAIVETIADEETGFLVRPGDVDGLARGADSAPQGPGHLRARIGTAARVWLYDRSMDAICRGVSRA